MTAPGDSRNPQAAPDTEADYDPDGDPSMLESALQARQPNQAEGADDPAETGEQPAQE